MGVGHDWNNLTTLEERQILQEVALYSFTAFLADFSQVTLRQFRV